MCDPVLRAEPSIGWDDNGAPRLNDYLFVGELKQTQNGQRQRASIQRHDINNSGFWSFNCWKMAPDYGEVTPLMANYGSGNDNNTARRRINEYEVCSSSSEFD